MFAYGITPTTFSGTGVSRAWLTRKDVGSQHGGQDGVVVPGVAQKMTPILFVVSNTTERCKLYHLNSSQHIFEP